MKAPGMQNAIERVSKYVSERVRMRNIDNEQIHGFHAGTDRECELLLSDIVLLLCAAEGEVSS